MISLLRKPLSSHLGFRLERFLASVSENPPPLFESGPCTWTGEAEGAPPTELTVQDALWCQRIYKVLQNDPVVLQVHNDFLLSRFMWFRLV
jgi:hypothetical protein